MPKKINSPSIYIPNMFFLLSYLLIEVLRILCDSTCQKNQISFFPHQKNPSFVANEGLKRTGWDAWNERYYHAFVVNRKYCIFMLLPKEGYVFSPIAKTSKEALRILQWTPLFWVFKPPASMRIYLWLPFWKSQPISVQPYRGLSIHAQTVIQGNKKDEEIFMVDKTSFELDISMVEKFSFLWAF